MKKSIISLLFTLLVAGTTFAQNNNQVNPLVNRAYGALGSCFGRAHQQLHPPYTSDFQVVSSCFAGGFITRVTVGKIIYGPICNPNVDPGCLPALPIYQMIGTVDFDCTGGVISTECMLEN